ncbi:MAG: c-type cytochrome [Betaproteobacteria bacterium]
MKLAASLLLAIVVSVAAVLFSGIYDISATDQHLAPTYWILDAGMRRSVRQRADAITVPELSEPGQLERGLELYRRHCVQCHGAPGVAPEPFALGLAPAPANLVHTAREWPPAAVFWVVKEGIKMTGMPAWRYRMNDADIWAVVAFMRELPKLSPDQYRSMSAPRYVASAPARNAKPDAARGRRAIHQYACATCHQIPGVVGANAAVGPPLSGIGTRALIAGALANTTDNMVRWLRHPQAVNPKSAMPDLGVSERDAHDIAAYLATLR